MTTEKCIDWIPGQYIFLDKSAEKSYGTQKKERVVVIIKK
jgi:hypothetical protein